MPCLSYTSPNIRLRVSLMGILIYVVHLLFSTYTILLFVRVVGSWFPSLARSNFMRFVSHYVDPYLNVFRRIVPPLGGVLDLSPLLAFFALRILEKIIIRLILL
jgi:YggT family protein